MKQLNKIVAPTHTQVQSRKHTIQLPTYSHLQAQGMQAGNDMAERMNESHKDSSIGTVLKICCTCSYMSLGLRPFSIIFHVADKLFTVNNVLILGMYVNSETWKYF